MQELLNYKQMIEHKSFQFLSKNLKPFVCLCNPLTKRYANFKWQAWSPSMIVHEVQSSRHAHDSVRKAPACHTPNNFSAWSMLRLWRNAQLIQCENSFHVGTHFALRWFYVSKCHKFKNFCQVWDLKWTNKKNKRALVGSSQHGANSIHQNWLLCYLFSACCSQLQKKKKKTC